MTNRTEQARALLAGLRDVCVFLLVLAAWAVASMVGEAL